MNMFVAVVGKLLPYTIIFCIMSVFANYIMFGVMHIPFACGFWPLNLTAILFVVATQALAVFLFSLFPAIAIVISVVSMVGSQGAYYKELDTDRAEGCIRDLQHAYSKDGGLAVLKGNIAQDGCVVKTAGVDESIWKFTGPAKVFDSQEAACDGILGIMRRIAS